MNRRIAMARKERNVKQDDLAKQCGLTKNFISLIENGKREPSDRTINDICRILNVNEEWLRTGEGEMFIELSRKDKLMIWATESLTSVTDDFRNRFVDVLDALDDDDWEVLANMAETLANKNKKKKD